MTLFFSKTKRRSLLVLAVAFLLSLCMLFLTACDDDDETPTVLTTDTCAIANGNFENFSDEDQLSLILSPSSWTRSNGQDSNGNSASTSSKTSGIIDVEEDLWESLTTPTDKYDPDVWWIEAHPNKGAKWAMRKAEKYWDSMSINDRLKFYDYLDDAIDDYNDSHDSTLSMSDFDEYSDYIYGIDYDDIPSCENPGTHDGAADGETGVLMLQNYRSDGYGTAQRYTSSTTVTLDAGTAAKVTLWVKTSDMTYNNGTTVSGRRGANINVTHTVGGTTLDQMQIKNIDTGDDWEQYTIYIKACPFATSTFTIVLGLGYGSADNSYEYVQGYAFFDDVDMEIISTEAYDEATQGSDGEYDIPNCSFHSAKEEKQFDTVTEYSGEYVYALDLYEDAESFDIAGDDAPVSVTYGLTTTKLNNYEYDITNYGNIDISTDDDIYGTYSRAELDEMTEDNEYLNSFWEDDFNEETYPFDDDEDIIMLMSAHGAPYTAKMDQTDDSGSGLFTLEKDEYLMISFWVKTSDTSGYTGATATLYDNTATYALGGYNTTSMSETDTDTEENIYDGWIQCFFFVSNETDTEKSFRLEFSYGPTTITGTTQSSYSEGYAAFTKFEYSSMTETDYDNFAGSASQSTTVSLVGTDHDGEVFDSTTTLNTETIKTNIANASSYTGVNGGSIWVQETDDDTTVEEALELESNSINSNSNAGLINKNYVGAYSSAALESYSEDYDETYAYAWLYNLIAASNLNITEALENLTWWDEILGSSTQPLLISNVVEQSYGYFSDTSALSSSGYSAISVRVKVSAGAVAYIYLIDTSDLFEGYGSAASVSTIDVTYWYDDESNVSFSDPEDDDYNAKTCTAFYRDDITGLYLNYQDTSDTNYYFNLANYDVDPDTGNLMAATDENGNLIISYDYADEDNLTYKDDGVAFYYNSEDDSYYAYYDSDSGEYSTKVIDFADASFDGKNFAQYYARYLSVEYITEKGWSASDLGENVTVTNTADTDACIIVDGDDVADEWVTVSFYIHTGSEGFDYRLELFSGSRDGSVTSAAGSYVIFDICNSADLSSSYDGLLDEAIEEMTDEDGYSDTRTGGTVYLEEDSETGRLVYAEANGDNAGEIYENTSYYCYSFYDDPSYRRYDSTLDENDGDDPFMAYTQSDYSETMTFLYYETSIGGEAAYTMFLDYSPIYQSVSEDTALDLTDDDDDNWWEDTDFWLMLSSIILAAVLIIVLIIILIVKLLSKANRKSQKADNRYNAKRMHYIRKLNLKTEDEEDAEEDEDEADEEEDETEDDEDNPYQD